VSCYNVFMVLVSSFLSFFLSFWSMEVFVRLRCRWNNNFSCVSWCLPSRQQPFKTSIIKSNIESSMIFWIFYSLPHTPSECSRRIPRVASKGWCPVPSSHIASVTPGRHFFCRSALAGHSFGHSQVARGSPTICRQMLILYIYIYILYFIVFVHIILVTPIYHWNIWPSIIYFNIFHKDHYCITICQSP